MAAVGYSICAGLGVDVGSLDGDGITSVDAALHVPGADRLVLDNVNHMPHSMLGDLLTPETARAQPWYGSEATLDEWLPWLQGGRALARWQLAHC